MINPVNYDYNTSIYLYLRVNSNYSAPQPVNRVPSVKPVTDQSRLFVDKAETKVCQPCKNRKYVDQSGDANVSFKSPAHISPESSLALVSSHEQEHVANAVNKGNEPGAQLVSSSVRLKTEVCPECGKPYISGGETVTQIRYNVSNPYDRARKSVEESLLKGMNFDAVA
jgi:NMD protein affecting ribosome stability and mRNA decay